MIKIGLIGTTGRMGVEIINIISTRDNLEISDSHITAKDINLEGQNIYSTFNVKGKISDAVFTSSMEDVFKKADMVIDFSSQEGLENCINVAQKINKPLLSGSTPMSDEIMQKLLNLSKHTKVCWSSNTLESMAIIQNICAEVAKLLPSYDCEIIEAHHRNKKDSPSGTAVSIGNHIAEARGFDLDEIAKFGRHGNDTQRLSNEIGFSSVRGGEMIFGEHEIKFFGAKDTISITHTCHSRQAFAEGAVNCAIKLYNKSEKTGFFTIRDLIYG